jgi:putative CocE/NonD family hydrolase
MTRTPPLQPAPPGLAPLRRSDVSYYIGMRDGVEIALNLYFRDHVPPAAPVLTMLAQTRYGRAGAIRDPRTLAWLDRGYVVASVDTRGSTASFGYRHTDIAPEEQADMEEIIGHLAAQPWSNGKVVCIGTSYLADTADMATSRPAPALVGAIPMQADFDVYQHLFYPGGVTNTGFIIDWGLRTRMMDLGQSVDGLPLDGRLRRGDLPALFPQLQPVDADTDCIKLHAALQNKQRWLPQDWLGVSFRDDRGANGHTLWVSSPASALAAIRRERKPVQYWGSWMDAGTADSALSRFRSAPEVPMEVWITPNDHGNVTGCDPFAPDDQTPKPTAERLLELQRHFVERVDRGDPIGRVVHYWVMGAGEFRSAANWPPEGMKSHILHFGAGGALAEVAGASGMDSKDIDLSTSSGPSSRWSGQKWGMPAHYGDRAVPDARLMTYDSTPLALDMELAGIPVLALEVATLSSDPAFFVYLEDVAPDGKVTFLTEGQFRAIHRRLADPGSLPYDQGPAPHSFARADATETSPGERMRVEFALSSVAALLQAGHRIRIAIGGADAHMFMTYANGGPERFDIHFGAGGSTVTLPLRPWR